MLVSSRPAAVMVTRRCTMKCRHCSVESHPRLRGEPDREWLADKVRELLDAGITSLQLTGGEPMLREDVVLELMGLACSRSVGTVMVSNGFWGKAPGRARDTLERLLAAGLTLLTISYDRYHAEFQGPEPALNIIRAAQDRGFTVRLNVVRSRDDSELDELLKPFRGFPNLQMRFYDLQPVGFADQFTAEEFRPPAEGFCSACEQAVVTDDGRMIACNGPAYFEKPESPLVLGSLREVSVQTLLERHAQDPVLDTIRTEGPWRLLQELREGGFERYAQGSYRGMCELCRTINRDPEAVAFLRERLADSKARSLRVAINLVKSQQRRTGLLNRNVVNHKAAAVVFFNLLAQAAPEEIDQRVLGRADLDWEAQANSLDSQGLLGLLAPWLDQLELTRWAPTFFLRRVEEAAGRDREAREADRQRLDALQDLLCTHRGRAWLVGEAASRALGNPRAIGSWQICLLEGEAVEFSLPGVRVLRRPPAAWSCLFGRPMDPLPDHSRLCVLDPRGRVIEAGLTLYRRRFHQPLAAAWDLRWSLMASPDLRFWAPAAFWAGVRPLMSELPPLRALDLNPPDPRSRRERILDRLASKRLFAAGRRPDNLFLPLGLALLTASGPADLVYLGREALLETVAGLRQRVASQGWKAAWREIQQELARGLGRLR